MNDIFEIPSGSQVLLGVPANPISKEAVDLLRKLVSEEIGIIEAHIPQCYIPIAIEDYVKNFLDIERDISYKDGYEISATHRK